MGQQFRKQNIVQIITKFAYKPGQFIIRSSTFIKQSFSLCLSQETLQNANPGLAGSDSEQTLHRKHVKNFKFSANANNNAH